MLNISTVFRNKPGLKIIFEQWPVVLTGQTNFSSVMSHFWAVKILKILILKNFPIKPKISLHMQKIVVKEHIKCFNH